MTVRELKEYLEECNPESYIRVVEGYKKEMNIIEDEKRRKIGVVTIMPEVVYWLD